MSNNFNTYDDEQNRHSDDLQDIITTVPLWLVRWGISLFFCILVLIFGISALISYPDVVEAQLTIDSSNPPKTIAAKVSGKLVKLLVTQDQIVKLGEPLALLESATDHSKYILTAIQSGKISFAGIIQDNQNVIGNQELFYVTPADESFYGEMRISQDKMSKIKKGQQVLIKLKAYPFEEYGLIKGKISYITEYPYKDGTCMAKVDFQLDKSRTGHSAINLKQGMVADGEIITQDASILRRLARDFNIF